MEHLVQSHMGGYYISELDENIIERICEQCFDRDIIVASWKKEDKEDKKSKLIDILSNDTILTKEDLLKYLESTTSKEEMIEEARNLVEYYTYNKKQLVEDISYDRRINDKLIKTLNKYINNSEKEQLDFIDNFDYSQIIDQKIKKIKYKKTQF